MQIKPLLLCGITMLLLSTVINMTADAEEYVLPHWNNQWPYKQEIKIPISTENPFSIYQPIDIQIEFERSCWAKNEKEHSIRVVCWDGQVWHELESQIYDLEYIDTTIINKCGLVFLIPNFANGPERYFVYYDDREKSSPDYVDHLSIEDAYYYSEPISGVLAEGDYYKIIEDDYCIYGIGQKGQILYRKLSQAVAKMRPGAKEFDYLNSDIVAALCFSYHDGLDEKDEISSDQKLVSKEICVDGNLMVEFGIVSESFGQNLRTTNIYKYYYCPTEEKRICVHVKHEVLEKATVRGIINVDGRYGALVSLRADSARIQKMRFGQILPYLHVYGENDKIREYQMDENPESKNREWIISYKDDCDLGGDAWISYDEGYSGKAHGIIFSSNKDIVKSGTNERDGIQLKVAEKEYLDIVGTEVDYAAINFGRNSYEEGGTHDLYLPDDLVVEYDMEFFTTENNGYKGVIEEGNIYRTLIKYRHKTGDIYEGDNNIYTLTVTPRLSGKILSYPRLVDISNGILPVAYVELYQDGFLISSGIVTKPNFLDAPNVKFPKLVPGEYVLKVYRKFGHNAKKYIGVETIELKEDTNVDVYCTWQKDVRLKYYDQFSTPIEGIELYLTKINTVIEKNITDGSGEVVFSVPFNFIGSYNLEAFYKGFLIYEKEIPKVQKNIDINIDLYDLTVEVEDELGLSPGLDVRPSLTSSKMENPIEINPWDISPGKYLFKNLPVASYELRISYGTFSDKKTINIPSDEFGTIRFTAKFDLTTELFDSRGDQLKNNEQKIEVIRDGLTIYNSVDFNKKVTLPPGKYTINVYSEDKIIGSRTIELTSSRHIKIVTSIEPLLPLLATVLVLIFIGEIVVLLISKRLSLNTFLKLFAMALILVSLFQPWWALNASSETPDADKTSEMYIFPQTMVDTINYKNSKHLELATIPEMFTELLGLLLIIVFSGFILLGVSFIPNIVFKRRFSLILVSASILFLVLVALAFYFGMSKICEISLGGLQGEGILDVTIPNGETVYMSSSWGLGNGFYLCIISALIAMIAGVLDFIKKKKWSAPSSKKK